jgi:hypothetical protein
MEEYILKIFGVSAAMLIMAFIAFFNPSGPSCFLSKEQKRQIEEFKKNKQEGKISSKEIKCVYYFDLPFVLFFRFCLFVGLGLLFVSFVLSFTQGIEFTKKFIFLTVEEVKSFLLSFFKINN